MCDGHGQNVFYECDLMESLSYRLCPTKCLSVVNTVVHNFSFHWFAASRERTAAPAYRPGSEPAAPRTMFTLNKCAALLHACPLDEAGEGAEIVKTPMN